MESFILIISEEEIRTVIPNKRDVFIIESIAKKANILGKQGYKVVSVSPIEPRQVIMACSDDFCYEFLIEDERF